MTRDEAITKAKSAYLAAGGHCSEASFGASIDAYVALGMLKLDEPKSVAEKLAELTEHGHRTLTEWGELLNKAGLKIVEK